MPWSLVLIDGDDDDEYDTADGNDDDDAGDDNDGND